jgi:hypothetical protein
MNKHTYIGYTLGTREKVPIIVLHGLLGSARNFQSWMKLSQQKEKVRVRVSIYIYMSMCIYVCIYMCVYMYL